MADALLASPPVLILDEPTAGLDPTQIRSTRALIRELGQEHTILLSTHILSEVEMTCDSVIIINRGRVVASGSLEDLARQAGEKACLVAVFESPVDPDAFNDALLRRGIIGPLPLGRYDPALSRAALFCATELNTREEIETLASTLEEMAR